MSLLLEMRMVTYVGVGKDLLLSHLSFEPINFKVEIHQAFMLQQEVEISLQELWLNGEKVVDDAIVRLLSAASAGYREKVSPSRRQMFPPRSQL